jgi:DNA processing protein
MDALELALILGRAPGLTAASLRAASEAFGDLTPLVRAPEAALRTLGVPPAAVAWLRSPDPALIAADRRWAEHNRIVTLVATAADYPERLGVIDGAPAVLYVLGRAAALRGRTLAMVGSRHPTAAGRQTAAAFAAHFARAGLTIVSGLAVGIDAASHEGALSANGLTVAVLGSGLDQIYPSEHAALAARIAGQGAVISEFPPGTRPLRENFARRNRIISGLCLGTLVVEAARRSGSLVTARLAGEQGREVFAIPGSIHNPLSRGCHALIRAGAKLVENGEDVLSELHVPIDNQILTDDPPPIEAVPTLDKDYKILLDALGFEPASADVLVERTGFSSQSVASMLLILELEGEVALCGGGRYQRLSERLPNDK